MQGLDTIAEYLSSSLGAQEANISTISNWKLYNQCTVIVHIYTYVSVQISWAPLIEKMRLIIELIVPPESDSIC